MNYVDSNIIIFAFLDTSEKGEASRTILEKQEFVTNTLTLDEVVFEIRRKSLEQALAALIAIENSPNILLVPFESEDLPLFTKYLKKGLAPRDAIHALTAEKTGCKFIYSEDKDFDRIEIPRKTPW